MFGISSLGSVFVGFLADRSLLAEAFQLLGGITLVASILFFDTIERVIHRLRSEFEAGRALPLSSAIPTARSSQFPLDTLAPDLVAASIQVPPSDRTVHSGYWGT